MQKVVFKAKYAAVKEVPNPARTFYDLWQWNPMKSKWVRVASGSGFGDLAVATREATNLSNEIDAMFKNNVPTAI